MNYQGIDNMARIGYFEVDVQKYEVYINTDDTGEYPHFHLNQADYGKGFHTCIRMDVARYYVHEGRCDIMNEQRQDLLDDAQISGLISFLQSEDSYREVSVWISLLNTWNMNNDDKPIKGRPSMSDYTALNADDAPCLNPKKLP